MRSDRCETARATARLHGGLNVPRRDPGSLTVRYDGYLQWELLVPARDDLG